MSFTNARDITELVKPTWLRVLEFPARQPAGAHNEIEQQRDIVRRTLVHAEEVKEPGSIFDLPHEWDEAGWEDRLRAKYESDADTVRRQRWASEYTSEEVDESAENLAWREVVAIEQRFC